MMLNYLQLIFHYINDADKNLAYVAQTLDVYENRLACLSHQYYKCLYSYEM